VLEVRGVKYLIYAIAFGIAVATILLVADYYYPFLPINPVSGPSPAARAGVTFWKESDENMVVPAAESPTKNPSAYSVRVNLLIQEGRSASAGKLRHVLHRGANPCGITAQKAGASGYAGVNPTRDAGLSADNEYMQSGLPDVVNPGLFLDGRKNDLHIFIHTQGYEGAKQVLWLESTTIEDLPINTPIDVGVICNGRIVEVYINCKLYSTWMLRGDPYLPSALNQWFGRYCASPFIGLVKNLQLWSGPLASGDYIKVCSTGSFKTADLPSTSCPAPVLPAKTSNTSNTSTN
jgi:hypothetical protein